MNFPPENLINPAAACRLLGIDHQSLLRGINDGLVPAYNIGGHIRFRPSQLRHPSLSGLADRYRTKNNHHAA